jgi:hypothetical protein
MYLTEEQTAFVANIKKMVDRHIAPIAACPRAGPNSSSVRSVFSTSSLSRSGCA